MRFENIETDTISPGKVREYFADWKGQKISPRMLSHLVHTTIGEAEIPASGRGSKRGFSLRDLYMMEIGRHLSHIGLPPYHVTRCLDTVRHCWKELFPKPIPELFTPEGRCLELPEWQELQFIFISFDRELEIFVGNRLNFLNSSAAVMPQVTLCLTASVYRWLQWMIPWLVSGTELEAGCDFFLHRNLVKLTCDADWDEWR